MNSIKILNVRINNLIAKDLLEQRYPDWRLTIVDDGPDRVN